MSSTQFDRTQQILNFGLNLNKKTRSLLGGSKNQPSLVNSDEILQEILCAMEAKAIFMHRVCIMIAVTAGANGSGCAGIGPTIAIHFCWITFVSLMPVFRRSSTIRLAPPSMRSSQINSASKTTCMTPGTVSSKMPSLAARRAGSAASKAD